MRRALLLSLLLALLLPASARAVPDGALVLADRPSGDTALPFDAASGSTVGAHALSADGCFVAFSSDDDDAIDGDDDTATNVLRVDRCTPGAPTALVSASTDGIPAAAGSRSTAASISADGRYVAFVSDAANLDDAAAGAGPQVYVKDLTTRTLTLVSRGDGAAGAAAPAVGAAVLSGDGRSVAFTTTGVLDAANADGVAGQTDLYVRRLDAAATVLASVTGGAPAGGVQGGFGITAAGDAVAFATTAALTGADADAGPDAYVTRGLATTPAPALASFSAAQTPGAATATGAAISADGTRVAWAQDTVWSATCAPACAAAVQADGPGANAPAGLAFAPSGSRLWWTTDAGLVAGDTDSARDLYSRSLADPGAGLTRVAGGATGTGTDDGAVVVWGGRAADGVTPAAWAAGAGTTFALGRPGGAPGPPQTAGAATLQAAGALGADGHLVAFSSAAPALGAPAVAGAWVPQVLTRDLVTQRTTLVSSDGAGAPADAAATGASVSADGTRVAFTSAATNLAAGTSPGVVHLYVRDADGGVRLLDRVTGGTPSLLGAGAARISGDGATVVFTSASPDLPGAGAGVTHVFAVDVDTGVIEPVDRTGAGIAGTTDATEPDVSADGRLVAFRSAAPELPGAAPGVQTVYVKDRVTGALTWAAEPEGGAPADGGARAPALAAGGTRIAFVATGAAFGHGVGAGGVAVRDLRSGDTVAAGPGDAPSLSADGTRVAFVDPSGAAPRAVLRDLVAGASTPLERGRRGSTVASVSASGRCVALLAAGDDVSRDVGPDYAHVYVRAIGGDCPPVVEPAAPAAPEPPPPAPAPVLAAGPKPEAGARLEGPFPAEGSRGRDTDIVPPIVGPVGLTNRRFAISPQRTAVRSVLGTTLRFTLSEDAATTIVVARPTTGRRSGRACVTPRPGLHRTCTRYDTRVTLARSDTRKGPNRIPFSGRWAAGALTPGTYRVTVTARDASGNRSTERRATFVVTRAR